MSKHTGYIVLLILLCGFAFSGGSANEKQQPPVQDNNKLFVSSGNVTFYSAAALEEIEASSNKIKGVILKNNNTFAFNIPYNSFIGFNSPLQKEHFNENFMESDKYVSASYTGRIIDNVNWQDTGLYTVRVKGILDIHGVKKERILTGNVNVLKDKVLVFCKFTILIADHNITIPRVLNQKIAEEVTVEVSATLSDKKV